jgi:hypothetical protein
LTFLEPPHACLELRHRPWRGAHLCPQCTDFRAQFAQRLGEAREEAWFRGQFGECAARGELVRRRR